MNAEFNIDILLATYNGEAYLPQLLESIFAQSYRSWRIIARDDNSTDREPFWQSWSMQKL
jgi:glycosyltransferase involved in cell wall biosynthesis